MNSSEQFVRRLGPSESRQSRNPSSVFSFCPQTPLTSTTVCPASAFGEQLSVVLALLALGRRRFRKLKRASRLKLFLVLEAERLLLAAAGALSRSPSAPSARSPLSRSHSGDDAPLHSLRGPSTGEMRPKSDSDTVVGRSRLEGLDRGDGEEEDEEGVGDGEAEEDVQEEVEDELAKGQGDRSS